MHRISEPLDRHVLPVVSPAEQELVDACVAAAVKLRALHTGPDQSHPIHSAVVEEGGCVVAILALPVDDPDGGAILEMYKQLFWNAIQMGIRFTGDPSTARVAERRTLPPQ